MKKIIIICLSVITLTACNNQAKHDEEIRIAKQKVLDSIAVAQSIKQKILDSIHTADSIKLAAIEEKKHKEQVAETSSPSTVSTKEKKGWSNKAKGAVIGGGLGAATGAIVSKNKAEGAVIGGVVGAAVGLGTGAILDDKKKKNSTKKN